MKPTRRSLVIVVLSTLVLLGSGASSGRAQSRVRTPATLTADLADRVISLELEAGLQKSLLAQLGAAKRAFERDNVEAGVGSLRAFQNHLRAQRGTSTNRRIFIYDADLLSAQAQIVVNVAKKGGPLLVGDVLTYVGGTIVAHPKVFVTFWGPDWQDLSIDFAGANVYGFLPGFLEQIGGTLYMETLTQYYQENANGSKTYISNDPLILKGTWIDPQPYPKAAKLLLGQADGSTTTVYDLTTEQMQQEVLRAVNHFGYDPDAIYFIATDRQRYWNTSITKAGAYHSSFESPPLPQSVIYAELPYTGILEFAQGLYDSFPLTKSNWTLSYASAVSALSFHELAEAIVDPRYGDKPATSAPFPSNYGWVSFDNKEIADICGDIYVNDPAVFTIGLVPFLVPQLWSNAAFGCVAMSP